MENGPPSHPGKNTPCSGRVSEPSARSHHVPPGPPLDLDHPEQFIKNLLGVDQFERVIGRWGFRGRAMLTSVRFVLPAPRRGLVAGLEPPGFRTDRLPIIPLDARSFVLGSFSPGKTLDRIREIRRSIVPVVVNELGADDLGEVG